MDPIVWNAYKRSISIGNKVSIGFDQAKVVNERFDHMKVADKFVRNNFHIIMSTKQIEGAG